MNDRCWARTRACGAAGHYSTATRVAVVVAAHISEDVKQTNVVAEAIALNPIRRGEPAQDQ